MGTGDTIWEAVGNADGSIGIAAREGSLPAKLAPLIIDTGRSQLSGHGSARFPDEQLAISLVGTPKGGNVLRLPGSMTATGTIHNPQILVPRQVKSVGNVLKGIGRALTERSGPKAADTNCGTLAQQAIGAR